MRSLGFTIDGFFYYVHLIEYCDSFISFRIQSHYRILLFSFYIVIVYSVFSFRLKDIKLFKWFFSFFFFCFISFDALLSVAYLCSGKTMTDKFKWHNSNIAGPSAYAGCVHFWIKTSASSYWNWYYVFSYLVNWNGKHKSSTRNNQVHQEYAEMKERTTTQNRIHKKKLFNVSKSHIIK